MRNLPSVGTSCAVHLTNGHSVDGVVIANDSDLLRMRARGITQRQSVYYQIDPAHIVAWSRGVENGDEPW